ncbi:MAG: penicillin-binding protein 2 [Deltaproteobacteria bacterium]|nr:penicillin-binding protein 2 [Deltaproteobacteria bacterium]
MALGGDLSDRNPVRVLGPRALVGLWLTLVAFTLLAVRLYALQVVRGDELASKGERNFVQNLRTPHDRGIVYDRDGRILADNRPSVDVEVTPAFLGKRPEATATLAHLATLVGMSADALKRANEAVSAPRGLDRLLPIVIERDLTPEQVEAVESERSLFHLDGVAIVEGRRRAYPMGSLAAHLLGYVKEIDAGELDAERLRGNPRRYVLGDCIGRDGVERSHEKSLRGVDGFEKIVVDAKGRRQHDAYMRQLLGEERRVEPQPGHAVFLTIDAALQRRAIEAFGGEAGAVVAVDPNNGKILVLASVPEFDPNGVSGMLGATEKQRLDGDPLKPWLNRAISGQYAPGSTFKAVTALAALAERATSIREKVRCPGHFTLGNKTWRCHKDSGHGQVDIREALIVSCDVFFYTMGSRIGITALAGMARRLGFGRRTDIALAGEQPGLVPDEAYHNRADRATGGYQRGMVVNTAIGQGSLLVTPLQLAMAYAAIGNGGTLFEPQIVDRIETADFRVVKRFLPRARGDGDGEDDDDDEDDEPEPGVTVDSRGILEEVRGDPPALLATKAPVARQQLAVNPDDLELVRTGLEGVMADPRGTAYWRRSRKISMAGKTGTAQVVRLGRERLKVEETTYFERDHAWFVAFAPATAPQIAVAVLNEHSGHGGSQAAPIAVAVVDAFVDLQAARLAAAQGEPAGAPR